MTEAKGSPPRAPSLVRVPLALAEPGRHALPPDAFNYVARVHRLGPGDRFVAFDPERAVEAHAELVEVTRRAAVARIDAIRPASVRPLRQVTLIQAACKGEKMDAIVRDATELGATRIIPAITERSIARPDPARTARWRRIAIEAARQCGRGDAPAIELPVTLDDALATAARDLATMAALCLDGRAELPLGARLRELSSGTGVIFLVGPEGGLAEGELLAAARSGFSSVRLGPLVLRTETVCAAILGALLASSLEASPAPIV